jgi:hypothetical protein
MNKPHILYENQTSSQYVAAQVTGTGDAASSANGTVSSGGLTPTKKSAANGMLAPVTTIALSVVFALFAVLL